MEQQILQNLEQIGLQNVDNIAVAVSGGSDSVFLAIILKKLGFNVVALIVNHNLRESSGTEAEVTYNLMESFGIKSYVLEWNGVIKKNLEKEARDARYRLLIDKCHELKIKTLAIGHHKQDQVETFLMNVSRGSGLDGLCAMPRVFVKDNVRIVRPLLNINKEEMQKYLIDNGVKWIEDESNADLSFKRNNLRYLLHSIEDKDLLCDRVLNTVNILQEIREFIDCNIEQNWQKIVLYDFVAKTVKIKKSEFILLPIFIQRAIMIRAILNINHDEYPPRSDSIEVLLKGIKEADKLKRTLGKCIIVVDGEFINIEKE